MVGTSPMEAPRPRTRARRLRSGAIPAMTSGMGEGTGTYVRGERYNCVRNGLSQRGVLLREAWRPRSAEAEKIVRHQHLTVAVGTRSDADHGHAKLPCDGPGQFARNAFQHNGKSSGIFESQGIAQQVALVVRIDGLAAEAALRVNGLRLQSKVAHDRNSRGDDARHG